MNIILNFIFKRPLLNIIVLLATTSFFIYQISNLQFDTSTDSLVLEGDDSLEYYQKIRQTYGSDNHLVISYQVTGNLFAQTQLDHLKNLATDLNNIKQIKSVLTILDAPLLKSPPISLLDVFGKNITINNGNADMELVANEFKTSPIYKDNLVSLDGKTTAILLLLKKNKKFEELRVERNAIRIKKNNNELSKDELEKLKIIERQVLINTDIKNKILAQTIAEIRTIIDKHRSGVDLSLGGVPLITTDIIAYINNDLIVFSLAIIVLMAVILALIFRNVRWVFIPIYISISVSLIMSGLLALLNWKITIISSNFFSLLLVITLSIIIHLVVRYRELAQDNPQLELPQLITNVLKQMLKPCFFTTLTTFIAFASLVVSDIRPIIDFGQIMSIGVVVSLLLAFITFPIVMALLPKIKILKHKTELGATYILAKFSEKFGNILIIILLTLITVSGFGISKLSVENRFIDYFKENTEINKSINVIDKQLGGTIPLEIILDNTGKSYWIDEELRVDIEKIHKHLESFEETGKVLSMETLIQVITNINGDKKPGTFMLNIIKANISENIKKQLLNPYLSEENDQLRIVVRMKETDKNLKRNEFIINIKDYLANDLGFKKDTFHVNGMLVLYNNMLQSLFESQIKIMIVVFIMIFAMFLFVFRSISLSIIALITNTLPSIFILGIMGILNISLDLMTITTAAIAIGVGVDNAIHYIHRFKIEFAKDADYLAAMYRSHASIGLAIFYTSITITSGFLILVLSNFIPNIYFGIFTAIAMISSLLANLTLLPKLILIFKPKI